MPFCRCVTIHLCLLSSSALAALTSPRTFCNPVDIDYAPILHGGKTYRHGADPVIVLFNNRYYLFSTWDHPGYRVSDDLLSWKYIPFDKNVKMPGYSVASVVSRRTRFALTRSTRME